MLHKLCDLLMEKKITVSVAESCTGGRISSALVSHPGISAVFLCGIVAYSNKAKIEQLNVPGDILAKYGAVSAQCAEAMAAGVRKNNGSDLAVATTGVAGPGGGSDEKPVGLVYIAISSKYGTHAEKFNFSGDREEITRAATEKAIEMLYNEAQKL